MNPVLVGIPAYLEHQWRGAVQDLRALIATGDDTPALINGIRIRRGLTPTEIEAARLDATLQEAG